MKSMRQELRDSKRSPCSQDQKYRDKIQADIHTHIHTHILYIHTGIQGCIKGQEKGIERERYSDEENIQREKRVNNKKDGMK